MSSSNFQSPTKTKPSSPSKPTPSSLSPANQTNVSLILIVTVIALSMLIVSGDWWRDQSSSMKKLYVQVLRISRRSAFYFKQIPHILLFNWLVCDLWNSTACS